jgi:hypothetical protein
MSNLSSMTLRENILEFAPVMTPGTNGARDFKSA